MVSETEGSVYWLIPGEIKLVLKLLHTLALGHAGKKLFRAMLS